MLNYLAAPTPAVRWGCLLVGTIAGLAILWGGLQPALAPPGAFGLDKIIHLVAFIGLGTLVTLPWRSVRGLVCAVAAVSLLGAGLELAQGMIPDRTASLSDWASDTVGALLGLAIVLWIRRTARLPER